MNPIEISRHNVHYRELIYANWFHLDIPEKREVFENAALLENITRVTEPPRDFACEYFQIREYAKSLEARGARGGGGMPVYNKAQYPRISLSCIFNDFLGDFGRSTERGGWKKKEKRKRKLGPQERKLRKLESLKPNYIYLPPRRTLLDRVLYCINHFLPFFFNKRK